MAPASGNRRRDKVVEPTVPAGFAEYGTPEFNELNGTGYGGGEIASAIDRVQILKRRHQAHVKHYNPWQLIGDRTQYRWQYLASPLSQHGPVVPPSYGELEKIERELVWLFSHSGRAERSATEAAEAAVTKYEKEFEKYDEDSKNGRQVAGAIAGFGAMAPSVPFLVPGAPLAAALGAGVPLAAAGVAAIGAAATHTAIEASNQAIEGTTLTWRELAPEAVKAGGAAFLSVFVWAKLSPHLMAKLPLFVAEKLSRSQLRWLEDKLGRRLDREQLIQALSQLGADGFANVLSAGGATAFEHAFDVLRSKQEMTLDEFAATLAANMLTVAGLQLLVTALIHAKPLSRLKSAVTRPHDEFELPLQIQVDELLRVQRANHPQLAEPVPWHASELLPHREVERIIARVRAFAHDNFSPDEADLIIRDLENWRQHPIQDPHIRRQVVDASAFLFRAKWFWDQAAVALRDGHAGAAKFYSRHRKRADELIVKAKAVLDRGKMSMAELDDLRDLYLDVLGEWKEYYREVTRDRQTPTLLNDGHFGQHSSNAAGVVDANRAGLARPDEHLGPFASGELTVHDYRHTRGLGSEYAPSLHSYLAAVDRRIDFAEAIAGFARLLSPRERHLLESVRFAARWENGWAPTAEYTWAATRPQGGPMSMDDDLVSAGIRVEREQGNYVPRQEMEQIVAKFQTFIAHYLKWLPDGELRKRNALFAEKLNQSGMAAWVVPLLARTRATYSSPVTMSPEEVMAFLKVDPKAPQEPLLSPTFLPSRTQRLRELVEAFICEHPLPVRAR